MNLARLIRRRGDVQLNSRRVLMLGFGGLLLLLAYAGLGGLQAMQQIQNSGNAARAQFLKRTRTLERIRADLYVSGTYVRDYLLENESGRADGHLYSLQETRRDMDAALAEYRGYINPREVAPFQELVDNLNAYWNALDPVMKWPADRRHKDGFVFLRDEVFPRRMTMLTIADQVGAMNEAQWREGRADVERTFARLRQHLMIAIGLTIVLGLMLALFSTRTILALETETANRYAEIAKAREALQALSARLVEVQEAERKAIARELHDEVGQSLTAALLEMANLTALTRAGNMNAVEDKAGEAKKLLEDSIGVVRNMALLLRPSMLDDLGLIPALQWQAREVSKRGVLRVKLIAGDVPEDLPDDHKTAVYRIVQEALNNGLRHSGAKRMTITVEWRGQTLALIIEDDGAGFDTRRERGMGLLGIQERVAHLGGTFEVESQPGKGTTLRVSLPVPGKSE